MNKTPANDSVDVLADNIELDNKTIIDAAVIKTTTDDSTKQTEPSNTPNKNVGSDNQPTNAPNADETPANVASYDVAANTTHGTPKPKKRHRLQQTLNTLSTRTANFYQKPKTYQGVNLTDDFELDAFRRQSHRLSKDLFGTKGASAYQLISKITPDDKLSAIGEAVYGKVADWASLWATSELKKDERFARLTTLSDDERSNWADEIKKHSHLWASVGGVMGFLGLKGVVLDTAWLLLVSLKSVYQLSLIYNRPLSGKDSTRLAYGILSKCDLDKLQEKQVIMTALALGDNVLKNAQSTSLLDEFKTLAAQHNYKDIAQLDIIANHINLDKFNPRWLHHLLPIASAALATHYNNELIEEVLGVAQATFADNASPIEIRLDF